MTSREQITPGAIGALVQDIEFSTEKSLLLAPLRPTLEMINGASPVFFTATACGGTVGEAHRLGAEIHFSCVERNAGHGRRAGSDFDEKCVGERRSLLATGAS